MTGSFFECLTGKPPVPEKVPDGHIHGFAGFIVPYRWWKLPG
jgi:hypothetical protein